MNKYVVAWTFSRHIHRHREHRLVLEFIDAESEGHANFLMLSHPSVRKILNKGFSWKIQKVKQIKSI